MQLVAQEKAREKQRRRRIFTRRKHRIDFFIGNHRILNLMQLIVVNECDTGLTTFRLGSGWKPVYEFLITLDGKLEIFLIFGGLAFFEKRIFAFFSTRDEQ